MKESILQISIRIIYAILSRLNGDFETGGKYLNLNERAKPFVMNRQPSHRLEYAHRR